MAKLERTKIDFPYAPSDFFADAFSVSCPDYEILVEPGKIIITLKEAQDPIGIQLIDQIERDVASIFLSQQLFMDRPFTLEPRGDHQTYENGMTQSQAHLSVNYAQANCMIRSLCSLL